VLQIYDQRERMLVRAADAALGVVSLARRTRRKASASAPARILLLRLERIGDLVMAAPAIADVRTLAPAADIDLVVGSWNAAIARSLPDVTRVETLDARWLARGGGLGPGRLLKAAAAWRSRRYDLAINFEPDIRSNILLAVSGASRTAGWASGGGGPVLDVALDYDPTRHTTDNARRLVAAALGRTPPASSRTMIAIPEPLRAAALAGLGSHGRPLVGVHVSGGRAIKQWDPERFAAFARRLADEQGATIVATGSAGDRAMVTAFIAAVGGNRVIDAAAAGDDLLGAAALLAQLDLLVTGDTGPMHLAAAVGTPVVAIFGPSDPARYATSGPDDRIVRVDLPCSPCNRIRRPPSRCVGHTPDCLVHVSVDAVHAAAVSVLAAAAARCPGATRS
jgi:ADP-heptose:LPS heptosyltransferase